MRVGEGFLNEKLPCLRSKTPRTASTFLRPLRLGPQKRPDPCADAGRHSGLGCRRIPPAGGAGAEELARASGVREEQPQPRLSKWRTLLAGSVGFLVLGLVVVVMAIFLSSKHEDPTPSPKPRPDPAMPAPPPSADHKSFTNSLGMEFVYIEPGEFMMGSPPNEPGRDGDEQQHKVRLTKGFYMQTTEVTQGQWKAVMGSNPSHFSSCGDECSVERISWNDVQSFIMKMNTMDEARQYRLPTEAEWEYSARRSGSGA